MRLLVWRTSATSLSLTCLLLVCLLVVCVCGQPVCLCDCLFVWLFLVYAVKFVRLSGGLVRGSDQLREARTGEQEGLIFIIVIIITPRLVIL